jgi:hypothetical protein
MIEQVLDVGKVMRRRRRLGMGRDEEGGVVE